MRSKKHVSPRRAIPTSIAVYVPFLILACSGAPEPQPPQPTEPQPISIGEQVHLAEQDIGPDDGGIIQIDRPGHPLHGLQLTVPPDSYDDPRTFRISSAEILEHNIEGPFDPLTPMIIVENGGGYSDELMLVEIPVTVPEAHFAMAFLYDPDTGALEGMQLISAEEGKLLIGTRRFSMFTVTGISQALLDTYLEQGIDTGFQPGVDDFSFENRGSFVSAGGHCAGQAIGAKWYYSARKAESGPLWGMYDNNFRARKTPNFWLDDSWAYRFCSMVQKGIDWAGFAVTFFHNIQGHVIQLKDSEWQWVEVPGIGDTGTRNLFALSMLLTGEPQFIGVRNMEVGGGHAMVAYSVTNDAIHIADPNYPGSPDRSVLFSDGKLHPYSSGASAEDIEAGNGKMYDWIRYLSGRTMIDYGLVSQLWSQVLAGTIGDDLFPSSVIQYQHPETKDWLPLVGDILFPERDFWVRTESGSMDIYRSSTKMSSFMIRAKIELQSGENLLGFHRHNAVGTGRGYVDFKWFTVVYEEEEDPEEPFRNTTRNTWHPTFAEAESEAQDGDEILVYPGTYSAPFRITKSLTVRSASGPDATIIDGAMSGERGVRIAPMFSSDTLGKAQLFGFTIQNTGADDGISAQNVSSLVMRNNVLAHTISGISAENIASITIENSVFRDNGVAMSLRSVGDRIEINANQVEDNDVAVSIIDPNGDDSNDRAVLQVHMNGNHISGGSTGVAIHSKRLHLVMNENTVQELNVAFEIHGFPTGRIQENHFSNTEEGSSINIPHDFAYSDLSRELTIQNNTFALMGSRGGPSLRLEVWGELAFENNQVLENQSFVHFDCRSSAGTCEIRIADNTIEKSGSAGIFLRSGRYEIINNAIRENEGRGLVIEGAQDAVVTRNEVSLNRQGGIAVFGERATISSNTITENTGVSAPHTPHYGSGGGVLIMDQADVVLTGNTIHNNHATARGGGVHGNPANCALEEVVTVGGEPRTVPRHSPPFEETTNAYSGNTHGQPFTLWGPGEDNWCSNAGFDVTLRSP